MVHMKNIKITYCEPCGFIGIAKRFKGELEKDGNKVVLEKGDHGIFDVLVDNKLVFSKYKEKRFPEIKEIKDKLK